MNTAIIEKKIAYHFKDKNRLLQAFLHRSYGNEHKEYRGRSNERLEFLGDSVLSLLIADYLYKTYTERKEGDLTMLRSALVSQKALAAVSQRLDLGEFLLMARGEEASGGRKNPSLLADVYEALLGAIYCDGGMAAASAFVERTLLPRLSKFLKTGQLRDEKSMLQEIVQRKTQQTPRYKLLSTHGPDHNKTFTVGVFIGAKKSAQE